MRFAHRLLFAFAWTSQFLVAADFVTAQIDEKLPIPNADARKKAVAVVGEVYGDQYKSAKTSAQKVEFAKSLLDDGLNSGDDPVSQFVLLRVARDVAASGADAGLALLIVDELDRRFRIDAIEMKLGAIETAARADGPVDAKKGVATAALSLVDLALANDRVDAASKLVAAAVVAARPVKDAALRRQVLDRKRQTDRHKQEFAATAAARATLEVDPADPDANLAVGKFYCFFKGDWSAGIPMLALGNDSTLKQAATRDLNGSDVAREQAEIGESWWDLAEGKKGSERIQKLTRAAHWYEKALPKLSGLLKVKTVKRLNDIRAEISPDSSGLTVAQITIPGPKVDAAAGEVRRFDVPKVNAMDWSHDGRLLIAATGNECRVYDVFANKLEKTLTGFKSDVRSLAMMPGGGLAVTLDYANRIYYWNLTKGQPIFVLPRSQTTLTQVSVSGDGRNLSAVSSRFFSLIDLKGRRLLNEFDLGADGTDRMAISSDIKTIVQATHRGGVRIYDIAQRRATSHLEGFDGRIEQVGMSKDARYVIAGGGRRAVVWDATNGKEKWRLADNVLYYVSSVAISPDGRRVWTAGQGKNASQAIVWDIETGKAIRTYSGFKNHPRHAVFSKGGRYVASGDERTLRVWEVGR